MPTDFEALDALYPLPPDDLYRQWVLTRDSEAIPPEWERRSLDGWHVGTHPDTHVCDLRAREGTPIGWAMEAHACLSGQGGVVPTRELVLPISPQATPADIESALYGRGENGSSDGNGLEGPWVAVLFGGTGAAPLRRVHLSATHSVVFSEQHRIVSTSHNLVPNLRRDESLSRAVDPLATNSYYTFGLTPFLGLRRLLPNHYLDLDTFDAVRHWPHNALEPLRTGRREQLRSSIRHAGLYGPSPSSTTPFSSPSLRGETLVLS